MGGFRDLDYVIPLAILAVLIGLCVPVLRASPRVGAILVAGAVLLVLVPWFLSERQSRRMLRELLEKEDRFEDDREGTRGMDS